MANCPSIYWGRLAGVTLTGEISADDAAAFWAATADLKAQIANALARSGIAAIVALGVPQWAVSQGSAEGKPAAWSQAGTTNYFVLPVQAFIPAGNAIPAGDTNVSGPLLAEEKSVSPTFPPRLPPPFSPSILNASFTRPCEPRHILALRPEA